MPAAISCALRPHAPAARRALGQGARRPQLPQLASRTPAYPPRRIALRAQASDDKKKDADLSEEDEEYAQSLVSGGVAKEASALAMKMLEDDPEVQKQLASVGDKAKEVATKLAAKEEVERQIRALEASEKSSLVSEAQQAQERAADAALVEKAESVKSAVMDVMAAQEELDAIRSAAGGSGGGGGSPAGKWAAPGIDDDAERIETAKAGAVASVAGVAGSLPFVVSGGGAIAALAAAGSSFLFGVTYRYALRSDVGNAQLKGGVVAAFALVRAIAQAEALAAKAGGIDLDVVGESALRAGGSMLIFGFAAVAIEAGFSAGLLSTFPTGGDKTEA